MRLNLGCGFKKAKDYINCDISKRCNPDRIVDLDKPLPFGDSSIDKVLAHHVCEHIQDFTSFMLEIHRVLKMDSVIEIKVPEFPCKASVADPDHVRFFILETFKMFTNPYAHITSNYIAVGLFDIVTIDAKKYTEDFTEITCEMKKVNWDYWELKK